MVVLSYKGGQSDYRVNYIFSHDTCIYGIVF